MSLVLYDFSLFTDLDVYLFKAGKHFSLYEKLGAHYLKKNKQDGIYFAVWAPNAESVSVIGDFNSWNPNEHPLQSRWDSSGIWEGFIPNLKETELYKFFIRSKNSYTVQKMDPFSFLNEEPPKTASIVWGLDYQWNDRTWQDQQKKTNTFTSPMNIYEVHLGSWCKNDNGFLNYREIAHKLVDYVKKMHFTHVELLPIMEHPFYGSWGYQVLGYFAPTSRYGTPQDFMYFVDYLHQNNIGIILDWVPSHFPNDEHGLGYFDGTHLYEHQDPRQGYHPDWNSLIFNYGRNEVQSFLISSACFWLDKYHIDGLRVDAVASMLYLDYSRKPNEWIPNIYGSHENLEAVELIKTLNQTIHEHFPEAITIAEESTNWPMVTKPVDIGGLGFHYKWNLGWMNDILFYFSKDPVYRKYHHQNLTFSMWYAYQENYVLVISHDEVVHGKGSLFQKMPKDVWQKYANIRLLFGYTYTHPGKKLLFMGSEIGQEYEWNHDFSLNLEVQPGSYPEGIQKFVQDLGELYQTHSSLYKYDYVYEGFEWIDFSDYEKSLISYIRVDSESKEILLIVCNFTPNYIENYRLGIPIEGKWQEILNSDHEKYKGSHKINIHSLQSEKIPFHNREYSISINIPPLGISVWKKI